VKNGFDSAAFNGIGPLVFNISEIRNPKDTQETGNFTFEIYDALGQLQYYHRMPPEYTSKMQTAPFLYSLVTSDSPEVSASALYTFTLTLSVDTDINTVLQITAPPEIKFDASRGSLVCRGLLSLSSSRLKCT
jgi:hypothetical protein